MGVLAPSWYSTRFTSFRVGCRDDEWGRLRRPWWSIGTEVAGMMGGDACVPFLCAQVQGFVPLLVPLVGHCLTSYVGLEEVE